MKLFNVIITWDVYCLANSEEAAIASILELIHANDLNASHRKALELRASPVRPQWQDEPAVVAGDISDEEFEQVRGKTTQQAYELLTKHPRNKP